MSLSGSYFRKAYDPHGIPPVVLKNCVSELAPSLVKVYRLCLSTSIYLSCWKFAHIQLVPKEGDHYKSNYHPTALISCHSKAFESLFNKKTMRHLSAYNLFSDCQYGFRKDRSIGDLAFLTESFSDYSETLAVGLDISKAFDRVWHKSLISKLPSYGF